MCVWLLILLSVSSLVDIGLFMVLSQSIVLVYLSTLMCRDESFALVFMFFVIL
jgi:hypothetical protein